MKRFLLILINGAVLALLFIGIPEATRADVVGYQISKGPTARLLILYGLGAAAAANVLAALLLIKDRKVRVLAWEWAGIFVALGLLQYAIYRGYYNFGWLKHCLLWLQAHL
jgi:hypothetical protein